MKSRIFTALMATVMLGAMTSCGEDPIDEPKNEYGSFSVEFEYVWGSTLSPFSLNADLYHSMSGDSLNFSTFRHYVSNVQLLKSDGSWWVADDSYHLLDVSDASTLSLSFDDVPAGDYVGMHMVLGVDSARNVSGAQTGALDPANGMFWSWNSGYIMLKAEGSSPQSGTGSFAYHLGGFSGPNKATSERDMMFDGMDDLQITSGGHSEIHMQANPARIFHTYGSVSNGPTIHMPGANAGQMAQDFNTWVRVDHIHN